MLHRLQIMAVERKYISWTAQHNNGILPLSALVYNNINPHHMQSRLLCLFSSPMTL